MTVELLKAAQDLRFLAEKANLPLEKFTDALAVYHEHEAAQQAERRANPEQKEAIAKAIQELNGVISSDLPIADILDKAGVRRSQGTASFAKREVKRVLLLAKPAA